MEIFRASEEEQAAGVPRKVLGSFRVAALLSLAAHGAIALVSVVLVARGFGSPPEPVPEVRQYPLPDPDAPIVVELAPMNAPSDLSLTKTAEGESKVEPPPMQMASGAKLAMVDDGKGKGGDAHGGPARNLAAHDEDHTTTDKIRDAASAEQENRLKSAKTRKSDVDLRIAIEPMELSFVASGKGFRYERHPVAHSDSSLGFAAGKGTAFGGAQLGSGVPIDGVGGEKNPGTSTLGGAQASPAKGAAYGQPLVGMPQVVGANVVKARPNVDKGKKPSVTSNKSGSPADDLDSDQAIAEAMHSLVSMSTKGGAPGEGKGGVGGGGAPGSGGSAGDGSSSVALGNGDGSLEGPHAYKRTAWLLNLQKRIGPLVKDTFPKEVDLDLRNGTVIVSLVIAKNGNVIDIVVVRPSGYQEFDQAVVTNIRGAKSFEPVPDVLAMGPTITVQLAIFGGFRAP
jgi:TonB family protein